VEIPPELLPHPSQVPPVVKTDADRQRFDLCFALTRLLTGRDDPIFTRQLYFSDTPTGDLAGLPEPDPDEQLDGERTPEGPHRA
jgi:hypothetical protein